MAKDVVAEPSFYRRYKLSMNDSKNILNLKDKPELIPMLAAWHHAQWGYLNPGLSFDMRLEKMRKYLGDEPIPSTYVRVDDDYVKGSAALVDSDMESHPELSPWLASVYVKPEARGTGIGSALVKYVMQKARELGFHELFLFTSDREPFYEKLGWKTLFKEEYRGGEVTVMKIEL